MQGFIGLALMVAEIIRGSLKTPWTYNPILDGVRVHPILDGGGGGKKAPVLTLPFSV